MKYYLTGILIALILLSGLTMPVYGSDITEAVIKAYIQATNNGTAVNYVAANFSLDTDTQIDLGNLDTGAGGAAIHNSSGADVAFMPGYGSNPWIVFYSSIPGYASPLETLYLGNVTGGSYCYFPNNSGMLTLDDPTTEGADNFTREIKAFFLESPSGNLSLKSEAYQLLINGDNITALIPNSTNNTYPVSYNDPVGAWADETLAYNVNTADYAYDSNVPAGNWSQFLELIPDFPIWANQIRVWKSNSLGGSLDVDLYVNGAWINAYQSPVTDGSYQIVDLGGFYYFTQARIRMLNTGAGPFDMRLHEFNFLCPLVLNYAGISLPGEHEITVSCDSANGSLLIDDSIMDIEPLNGASIPDNSSDWVDCLGSVILYMEYLNYYVNGILVQSIEWDYGTTFEDLSGNGNEANPGFRTTGNSENITAVLIDWGPYSEAVAGSTITDSWPDIMDTPPTHPTTAYTEESRPGVFFEPLVHTIWGLSGLPDSLFWYNFTFTTILLAGMLTFRAFAKHNLRALLLKVIVMGAIMIFWALPGPNVYGMYTVIYFGLFSFGALVLSRSYGW